MSTKVIYLASIILALALLCGAVAAHDLWLVPQKYRCSAGESVKIAANTGMDFPQSTGPVTPDRIRRFFYAGVAGRQDITGYEIEDKSLIATVSFEEPGSYVVAAELKPKMIELDAESFNDYVLHDGLKRVYDLRKRKGLLDEDAVEFYSKFPKTIVQVGDAPDDSPTLPLGLNLEIVPGVNPYKLSVGDSLEVTVFYRGAPLAGAEVSWSYPGLGGAFAGTVVTDGDGHAAVPLQRPGPFVIRRDRS